VHSSFIFQIFSAISLRYDPNDIDLKKVYYCRSCRRRQKLRKDCEIAGFEVESKVLE
jgi:hypothetical protein